jgi:hypothetical protein
MSVYNLYSDAKVQTALTAVGGTGMGQQEVDLLKQIFVAAANGGGGGGASSFSELSGSPYDQANLAASLGYFHVDAGEMIPRVDNGAGVTVLETTTNKRMRDGLTFQAAADRFAQFWFLWPPGWNTFTVTFYWRCASGTGSVVWAAQANVITDGDAEDAAWGTAQTVTDAAVSANTQRQSSPTPAITPAGTIGDYKATSVQIYRDADAVGDDMPLDAILTRVMVSRAS